ncbi:MAG: alpha/beta hydrolase [Ferruginibacter sp.]
MNIKFKVIIAIVLLSVLFLIGPKPTRPEYNVSLPSVPAANKLDSFITSHEVAHKLRPDNQARIIWANDTAKTKTTYSIVYLHGFSASQEEGDPVHRNIARTFGYNLFLARLSQHGIDTSEQLLNLTADNYWQSAKEALAIGKQLGDRVILMGTSTGASQALQLAATYPGDIAALVLYSPNIEINDPNAWVLNEHWGLQIARIVKGSPYNIPGDDRPIYKQYWNSPYRLEAAVALEEMLETSMNKETFEKIKQPLLLLYYYKDEGHQDKVVKVSAMKKMFEQIVTPKAQKRAIALPNAGNHVLASPIKSHDVEGVERETRSFLTDIMKLPIRQ